jgi:hypothetical protein
VGYASDPEKRFLKAVRRGEPSSFRPDLGPCLIYLGADNGNGYGQFRFNYRNGYAHRYAWERVNGPIPDGLTVDHLCRVRRCVEVTHLELVDGVTNYRRGKAAQTHCPNGHEYNAQNTGSRRNRRQCLICQRDTWRRGCDKKRKSPDEPNLRIKYDQKIVRAQIAEIQADKSTIAESARIIGCHPNYLGRRVWEQTRAKVLHRDGGRCLRCGSAATDVHHRIARGMGGSSKPRIAFGMDNLVSLCRSCHSWVESHRILAQETGWLVSRGANPEDCIVLAQGRPVRLTRDGRCVPLSAR